MTTRPLPQAPDSPHAQPVTYAFDHANDLAVYLAQVEREMGRRLAPAEEDVAATAKQCGVAPERWAKMASK